MRKTTNALMWSNRSKKIQGILRIRQQTKQQERDKDAEEGRKQRGKERDNKKPSPRTLQEDGSNPKEQ